LRVFYSGTDKSEQSAVIKRIRAGKGVPKAPPIEAQQIIADPTDEETL